MKRAISRRISLALALLVMLGALGDTAAAEALTAKIVSGVLSWNSVSFADIYHYWVDDDHEDSAGTTGLSVNIDAYIDGLIAAGKLLNTGEHTVWVEAYNTVTFDTLQDCIEYSHYHPTLPVYEGTVYAKLADSTKYDKATGVLSWSQYSDVTRSYFYSVNDGPAQVTEEYSVNIHKFIDEQVTNGDIPYAESFVIRLTANKANGDQQDAWQKTIDYVPNITKIDIDDPSAIVQGIEDEYLYTGAPIQPAVTGVFVKGKALKPDVDYKVSYGENTAVGTGTVVVHGKGRYTGKHTVTFVIRAKDPDPIDAKIDGGKLSWKAYPGASSYSYGVNGLFHVTTALSVNIDAYIDGLIATAAIAKKPSYEIALEACDAGGIRLQSWKKTYAYASAAVIDIAPATVSGIPESAEYTGSPITPEPVVKLGGKKLVRDVDYTVSYAANTDPGTASVTIAGIGLYGGAMTLTFQIVRTGAPETTPPTTTEPETPPVIVEPTPVAPIQISLCAITVKDQVYTGKALMPAPVVAYGGAKLKKGVDYTVAYKNNRKVGRATLTVKGKGTFTGRASVPFVIAPKAVVISGIDVKGRKATVRWKAQSRQVSGYQLQYATNKRFSGAKKVKVSGAKQSKRTLTGLKAGRKYYVRLRAWHRAGGKTWYSAWSKIKRFSTPK